MRLVVRTACCCAFVLLIGSAAELRAQERRDSTRRAAATSAEELHRVRRAWLEQHRLGRLDGSPPVFGSAIVGPPRPGHATGIAVGGPVRGGYGAPFGLPYGAGALHCDALIQSVGFGGYGGYGGFGGHGGSGGFGPYGGTYGWPFGGAAFAGRCLPLQAPLLPFGFTGFHGFPGRDGLPYPAYPAYGRFYGRFNEDARRRYEYDPLLYGIQEYDWGWWGPMRTYPGAFGWADGAYGWYSAPPWSRSPADCVDLTVVLGNGRAHRLQLGLQSLGLADTRDLDLAIDARLSQGRPVMLQGLDGRVLRIEPGTAIDDLIVGPCGG